MVPTHYYFLLSFLFSIFLHCVGPLYVIVSYKIKKILQLKIKGVKLMNVMHGIQLIFIVPNYVMIQEIDACLKIKNLIGEMIDWSKTLIS